MKKWMIIDQVGNIVPFEFDKDVHSDKTLLDVIKENIKDATRFKNFKELDKIVHETLKNNKEVDKDVKDKSKQENI